jgi:hypothetical protein
MNDSTREISPLRQRMLEDMRLRKLALDVLKADGIGLLTSYSDNSGSQVAG